MWCYVVLLLCWYIYIALELFSICLDAIVHTLIFIWLIFFTITCIHVVYAFLIMGMWWINLNNCFYNQFHAVPHHIELTLPHGRFSRNYLLRMTFVYISLICTEFYIRFLCMAVRVQCYRKEDRRWLLLEETNAWLLCCCFCDVCVFC